MAPHPKKKQKQSPENQNNDAKTTEFTKLETRFSDTQLITICIIIIIQHLALTFTQ